MAWGQSLRYIPLQQDYLHGHDRFRTFRQILRYGIRRAHLYGVYGVAQEDLMISFIRLTAKTRKPVWAEAPWIFGLGGDGILALSSRRPAALGILRFR